MEVEMAEPVGEYDSRGIWKVMRSGLKR